MRAIFWRITPCSFVAVYKNPTPTTLIQSYCHNAVSPSPFSYSKWIFHNSVAFIPCRSNLVAYPVCISLFCSVRYFSRLPPLPSRQNHFLILFTNTSTSVPAPPPTPQIKHISDLYKHCLLTSSAVVYETSVKFYQTTRSHIPEGNEVLINWQNRCFVCPGLEQQTEW
jgi:hypothetical protein